MDEIIRPEFDIQPPLLNSANPWATTFEDLKALYQCPYTGAVTTRTTLLNGFAHDPAIHQYTFFNSLTNAPAAEISTPGNTLPDEKASLNNMGYSPIPLNEYLGYIEMIVSDPTNEPTNLVGSSKVFIISVTGTPKEVGECYKRIVKRFTGKKVNLAMEVNLSCPNIPNAPPPAYDPEGLRMYMDAVGWANFEADVGWIPYGIKIPPYTHIGQFEMLISALRDDEAKEVQDWVCPSFITATNTLGSCLVLNEANNPKLAGTGIGGMAGAPLHPLALGNVRTLRRMLDAEERLKGIKIIGVGGVEDAAGYMRMTSAGASIVGVGTAFGRRGVDIFREIVEGVRRVQDFK
ncbi:dihydroorotate dehydrogenase [Hypoxylon fuscum]|nr:dihydroorotate dehydrogenase [Hypoxylon fuscum]